jgi:hypothetical protein
MPVPNSGKLNKLIAQLNRRTVQLGLYKNVVTPTDGSLTAYSLTEMPTGGGRGYAPMELARVVNLSALAASQWYIAMNAAKAQAQFSNAALQWTMTSVEVADGNTPQGGFGFCWFIPFQSGAKEIKVGDIIKGVTSAAAAVVTDVLLLSGTWAGGTAAGYLYLETKTGTFQNGENLTRKGAVATVSIVTAGTGYAVGDILQITQTGGSGVKIVVLDVDSYGGVTDVEVVDGGMGYAAATGLPTTHLTGSGADNLTLTIATLATATYAVSNSGSTNGGDALKDLMFLSAIATPVQITTVGQPIVITPILTEDTDPTVG